jgi:glycolate oxidase
MDRLVVEISAASLGIEWPCKTGTGYLMFIVEGRSDEEVHLQLERISEICQSYHCLEPVIGETKKEQEKVLKIRSNVYSASKRGLVADALDVAVPPASMGKLMDAIDRVANEFGTVIPMVGHVGDGNLHPTLIKSLADGGLQNLKKAKREIYKEALKLGGTMTAEHGVGKIRIPDVAIFLDKKTMELMRSIKEVFDPNGILNPGCAVKSHKK